jgi:hypothetical protein
MGLALTPAERVRREGGARGADRLRRVFGVDAHWFRGAAASLPFGRWG